jgi:RNA polymerase sigma factor (sigma-70 family)
MNDQTARPFVPPISTSDAGMPTHRAVLAPVLDPHGRIPDSIDARLADLARRAQGGDLAARNGLFLALWPRCAPLLGAIRRSDRWRAREGRAWTFDDVEQEAFPIFCELVAEWRGDQDRFAGYFFTRFRFRLTDLLRSWTIPIRAVSPLSGELDVIAGKDQTGELRLLIDSLFASLGERDRRILVQRIIEGRTDAEIAAANGVSVKTVRRWRKAAFARAQVLLRESRETLRL